MEFFSHPIIAVIILLGLLVFVHETGHYVVGRLCGIGVEIYSIGFGPTIVNFRRGDTEYRLSWIPLGGYVKFFGMTATEDVPESLRALEFSKAPAWKRSLTVAAGPVANFLLAIICYTGMGYVGMPQAPAVIGEIMSGSPAEQAGIRFGDRIAAIDGKEVRNWHDLQKIIVESAQHSIVLQVERGGVLQKITVTPDSVPDEDKILRKKKGQIGISPGQVGSVVTVVAPDGPAARAGLVTGDHIVSVVRGGTSYKALYWRSFLDEVIEARRDGLSSVGLEVKPENPEAAQNSEPEARRSLTLEISSFASTDSPDVVAEKLGINHSLLTVFAGKGPEAIALRRGDQILKWDGIPVANAFQLRDVSVANQKQDIVLTVLRDAKVLDVPLSLKPVEIQKASGKAYYYMLPVIFWGQLEQPEPVIERYDSLFGALRFGITETSTQGYLVFSAVLGLFTGDMPLEALGGPISIAKVASDSVRMGWQTFIAALAIISINLGLLNLFPIPVLDGGQLLLIMAERVRGRPLTAVAVENYQKVGFVMIMALVIMATYNDLSRFWTSMIQGVLGMFQ